MKKIVIGTKNEKKLLELQNAFKGLPVEVVSVADFGDIPDAIEDGETFSENALKKARYFMEQTGCACIADDSGLEVDALNGLPGVHSARFAGFHAEDGTNNRVLMRELDKAGVEESRADYRCALVFVDTNGTKLESGGVCYGTIKREAKGTGGFGYDPYFYFDSGKTMAELSLEEKDKISHRGAALRQMVTMLERYL